MAYSVLLVIAIALALLVAKRWQGLPAVQRKKNIKQTILLGGAALLLVLVVAGRAHWLTGVLAAILAVFDKLTALLRYKPIFNKFFNQDSSSKEHHQSSEPFTQSSRQQAAQILGVNEHASEQEVIQAYKKLMQKVHPDRGGTDALASQINQAKDVLLNRRTQ